MVMLRNDMQLQCEDPLKIAYGVNFFFDSVFPLPCFYLPIRPIQSVYHRKDLQ